MPVVVPLHFKGQKVCYSFSEGKIFLKKDKIPQTGLVQVPSCPDRARGCGGWHGAGAGSSLRGRVGVPQGPRQAVGWPRVQLAPRCRAVREALRGLWVQPAMKGGSAVAFGSHGRSALGVGAVRAGAGQGLWSFGSSHWGHVGTTHWGPKCHGRGAKAMAGQQVGRKVFLHARTWACPTAACPHMAGPCPCCSVSLFPHTCPETSQWQLLSCLKAISDLADKEAMVPVTIHPTPPCVVPPSLQN